MQKWRVKSWQRGCWWPSNNLQKHNYAKMDEIGPFKSFRRMIYVWKFVVFHRHMATGPQSLLLDVVGGSPFLGLNQWHRQWRAARHYCLQRRHQGEITAKRSGEKLCFLSCFKRDWNWWCHYDFTISLWFHQHFFRTCSELSWMWFIPLQWILSKFHDH